MVLSARPAMMRLGLCRARRSRSARDAPSKDHLGLARRGRSHRRATARARTGGGQRCSYRRRWVRPERSQPRRGRPDRRGAEARPARVIVLPWQSLFAPASGLLHAGLGPAPANRGGLARQPLAGREIASAPPPRILYLCLYLGLALVASLCPAPAPWPRPQRPARESPILSRRQGQGSGRIWSRPDSRNRPPDCQDGGERKRVQC